MRKKRTTKITVETERIFVITSGKGEVEGWCEGCGAQVRVVPSEMAATLTDDDLRTIYNGAVDDTSHHTETTDAAQLRLNSFPAGQEGS